jgi:hypothetical protein
MLVITISSMTNTYLIYVCTSTNVHRAQHHYMRVLIIVSFIYYKTLTETTAIK